MGGVRVVDLRNMKNIVIPNGAEFIGSYWFYDSKVETVVVPASVRRIWTEAFGTCLELKKVTFEGESRLEEIGEYAFAENENLQREKMQIPVDVRLSEGALAFDCHRVLYTSAYFNKLGG